MDKAFFDQWEFIKTTDFSKDNPYEAEKKFAEYFDQYPKDYSGYPYYIYCLITLGKFDEAEKKLNALEYNYKHDPHFAKQDFKIKMLKRDIAFNRIRLYCYQGKYKKLYNYYLANTKYLLNYELKDVIYYSKVKTKQINMIRDKHHGYLFRQMTEYREEDFLNHIKKHLADYNKDLTEPNKNIFVPDFPIQEVLEEVKKYIPSNRRQCGGFWEDSYIFKYNECGRENHRLVNYFKVVCFHDTNQMITVCPVEEHAYENTIDLTYMEKKREYKELKKKSKVDRFNRKYKR